MSDFITPPILNGTEQQQLLQLRDYLFQLHRQLGTAVTAVEEGNFSTEAAQRISERATAASGGASAASKASLSQQVATLKSLIVKTADMVVATEERIEMQLQNSYVAVSDFGNYMESNSTRIKVSGKGIEEVFENVADLNTNVGELGTTTGNLSEGFAALDQYVSTSKGYIRQGVIGYREDGITPIIGIAIGQDIQISGTAISGGKEYVVIDTSSAMTTLTPEKLSFHLNGDEVAYFGSNGLVVAGAMTMGDWQISRNHGFSIKWVGA